MKIVKKKKELAKGELEAVFQLKKDKDANRIIVSCSQLLVMPSPEVGIFKCAQDVVAEEGELLYIVGSTSVQVHGIIVPPIVIIPGGEDGYSPKLLNFTGMMFRHIADKPIAYIYAWTGKTNKEPKKD